MSSENPSTKKEAPDTKGKGTNDQVTDNSDIEDISEEIKSKPKKKQETESIQQFKPGKQRKWVKWVVIGVIGVGVILFAIHRVKQKAAELEAENAAKMQTADIKKMDITSSIASTGTIQSKDVRTLTSPLTGVKIDEVSVKVGDMVNEGDVVVTFSREDINKKIGQLEEDITEAQQVKALDAGDRTNTYVNSNDTDTYNVASAYTTLLQKEKDLEQAKYDLSRACEARGDYRREYEKAKDNIDSAKDEYIKEKAILDGMTMAADKEAYEKQSLKVSELQSKYSNYKSKIDNYDPTTYDNNEISAQKALETAQRNYDDALVKYEKSGYDASMNGAKSDYTYNKGNVQADDKIKDLKRQKEQNEDSLDNYLVTAPISGLVTSVSAQKGNGYQATTGALMTIQAVDVFEVSTQIDEYDINNVHLGQKVVIMTDATGDDELEGIVTFIAPTASSASTGSTTASNSTSTTATTFEVKIDINNKDERLRLGMTAKLNIIKDSHNGVLAVPYDAIEEKEGGSHVIYVVDKSAKGTAASTDTSKDSGGIQVVGLDGADKSGSSTDAATGFSAGPGRREIPVQIGLEGSYYTEIISPDIKEGMQVVVNSEAGQLQNDESIFGGPR